MNRRLIPIAIAALTVGALFWLSQGAILRIPTGCFDCLRPSYLVLGRAFLKGLISVVLLAAALWVILSQRYQATDKHWAYGTIGTLIGFWLKQ